jgi:hypothetical protein
MKITLDKERLNTALLVLTSPTLGGYKYQMSQKLKIQGCSETSTVRLTTVNSELSITLSLCAEVFEPGSWTIQSKELKSVVEGVFKGSIQLCDWNNDQEVMIFPANESIKQVTPFKSPLKGSTIKTSRLPLEMLRTIPALLRSRLSAQSAILLTKAINLQVILNKVPGGKAHAPGTAAIVVYEDKTISIEHSNFSIVQFSRVTT